MSRFVLIACFAVFAFAAPAPAQRFIPRPRPVRPPTPFRPHIPIHGSGIHHNHTNSSEKNNEFLSWFCPLSIIGGVIASIGVWYYLAIHKSKVVKIRIISIPDGEAPQEIRRAWVGLELPLVPGQNGPRAFIDTYGVLTGKAAGAYSAYVVNGPPAIAILHQHDMAAADWWKENAAYALDPGFQFGFPVSACELVT